MASAAFEQARKNPEAFMAGGVSLVFPAFDDLPEKKLWFGTLAFDGDGDDYVSALADLPTIKMQRGLGQDTVDFSINDADSKWYEILKPYEDVVEDTTLVVKEFLKTADGIFESETAFVGFLEQMTIGDKSGAIDFSGISDMSRSGFLVGGRILTQRYCAAKFNRYGLLSPLLSACGWQTAQGGNPLFCTHKLKGVDGCEDHLNDWRYFAVEALSTAEITTVAGGGDGGWGYGGGHSCFTPNTLCWMGDGSHKPIYKIEVGDLVWSFTAAGELVKRRVVQTFKHLADSHLVFDFGKDRILNVTPEHLFCVAPDVFKAAAALDAGETVRARSAGDWLDFVIRRNWLEEKRTRVHNFHVEETETYFVIAGDRKIAVHNRKEDEF